MRLLRPLSMAVPLLILTACRPPSPSPSPSPPADGTEALLEPASRDPRTDLPTVVVPHVAGDLASLDGVLDDAMWAGAARTEAFVSAGDGSFDANSPVNGHALLAFTDEHLWAAFVVYDRAPESPNARDAVDPHVWATASGIELMIQPGDPGDNTNYYEIQVDTAEAVWDTRFDDYNRPITGDGDARRFGHQDWASGVERAVRVDAERGLYVVEMRVPWTSFDVEGVASPPAAGDRWRANFYTFRDGQRHARAWSPLLGEGNFHRSSRFGTLEFRR